MFKRSQRHSTWRTILSIAVKVVFKAHSSHLPRKPRILIYALVAFHELSFISRWTNACDGGNSRCSAAYHTGIWRIVVTASSKTPSTISIFRTMQSYNGTSQQQRNKNQKKEEMSDIRTSRWGNNNVAQYDPYVYVFTKGWCSVAPLCIINT